MTLFLCPCSLVTCCCTAGPDFTEGLGVTNKNYNARRGRCGMAEFMGFLQTQKEKHTHIHTQNPRSSIYSRQEPLAGVALSLASLPREPASSIKPSR